eukprot:TRINITY_DN18603_c0_g1_i1.p1 TRINITY_DN18603_c0_g1~~TRINITY_DN18603_c0_g1_i1.p1  ORF type:complete len:447 (-),score=87.40 TRINITY_DN18603_c0_g1_i1:158-1363(-)
MKHFEFTAKEFDEALRETLSKFRLPGEAQKIDRVVEAFALRYVEHNPGIFPHHDTAYVLAFSVIMLNTDLHNPSIKKKMTKKEFLTNNKGIAGGKDLPAEFMEELYDRVVKNEIKIQGDGILTRAVKQGWLHKLGLNYLWQKRWFVLSNNTLYYYLSPDDHNPRAIIPLVGLTVRRVDAESSGYDNAFELFDEQNDQVKAAKFLGTASKSSHKKYLFRAASDREVDEWISALDHNIVGDPILNLVNSRKEHMFQDQISGPNDLESPRGNSTYNASNYYGADPYNATNSFPNSGMTSSPRDQYEPLPENSTRVPSYFPEPVPVPVAVPVHVPPEPYYQTGHEPEQSPTSPFFGFGNYQPTPPANNEAVHPPSVSSTNEKSRVNPYFGFGFSNLAVPSPARNR